MKADKCPKIWTKRKMEKIGPKFAKLYKKLAEISQDKMKVYHNEKKLMKTKQNQLLT